MKTAEPGKKKVENGFQAFWGSKWFSWLTFGIIAIVYLLNKSPFVSFHDSLGFLYDAVKGFTPATNATSHFLWNNLQHLLVSALPFISPVLALTVFSVLSSLGALWLFYKTAQLFIKDDLLAVLATVVLAFSFTWWQQSEIIEVYSFNSLVFLSYFYLASKDLLNGRSQYVIAVGVLLGIGFLTHVQHVLSIPFYIFYLVKIPAGGVKKMLSTVCFLGITGLLIIPPIILKTNSIAAIFFDGGFRSEVIGFQFMSLLKGFGRSIIYLVYNFHFFLFFIFLGIFYFWKNSRPAFWILVFIFFPYYFFAAKYDVNDAYVFFLIAYIPLGIGAAAGFFVKRDWLKENIKWVVPVCFFLSPLIYGATFLMAKQVPQLEKIDAQKSYKGGISHFFWPGKAHVGDPLQLAQEKYAVGDTSLEDVEWRLEMAVKYLRLTGELEDIPLNDLKSAPDL